MKKRVNPLLASPAGLDEWRSKRSALAWETPQELLGLEDEMGTAFETWKQADWFRAIEIQQCPSWNPRLSAKKAGRPPKSACLPVSHYVGYFCPIYPHRKHGRPGVGWLHRFSAAQRFWKMKEALREKLEKEPTDKETIEALYREARPNVSEKELTAVINGGTVGYRNPEKHSGLKSTFSKWLKEFRSLKN